MSSLCLNPALISDLCNITARSRDETAVIKYALSSKETFASFQQYVRDHVTARFENYKLDFYDDDWKLEISPLSLLPKMVFKLVIPTPENPDKNDKNDYQTLNILDGNKVVDTLDVSFLSRKDASLLTTLLSKLPTVKNLTCSVQLPLNNETSDDFFKITFDRDSAVTSLNLKLEVQDASLDYFDSMLVFLKQFPKLEFGDIIIHNTTLQDKNNIASNVKELQTKFLSSELLAQIQIHLVEDYKSSTLNNASIWSTVAPPPEPNMKEVHELLNQGFEDKLDQYRRQERHLNSVFTHDVCFKDPDNPDFGEFIRNGLKNKIWGDLLE